MKNSRSVSWFLLSLSATFGVDGLLYVRVNYAWGIGINFGIKTLKYMSLFSSESLVSNICFAAHFLWLDQWSMCIMALLV